jgi:predicted Zn-dependent peptidase
MPIQRELIGGLRVIVEPLPHTYSASICCMVAVGSAYEQAAQSGMAHFVEHMLFRGTPQRPSSKELVETIEGVGGIIDAYTSLESTVYSAKVAHVHVYRALDVLADMLQHSLFRKADVEKERRVIIEEISQTADTPAELVHLLSDAAVWGDQPVGRDIAGSVATVQQFQRDELHAYWQSHYTRENMVISIAGNVDVDAVLAYVAQAFADLPATGTGVCVPTSAAQPGPQVQVQALESEQVHFCLAMPGLSMYDPAKRAMMVFDAIVGGNSTSRLFQEIREERALAYTIGSYSREYVDAGKWVVSASVDADAIEETIQAVMDVLRAVRQQGVTAAELEQVKEQVKGGIWLSLEDSMSIALRNGSHLLRYGHVIAVDDVVAEVARLHLDDVMQVAERILDAGHMHLTLIGPVRTTDTLLAQLHM